MRVMFKNNLGKVEFSGEAKNEARIKAIEGMGLLQREYSAVVYSGYDGQETLDSRALPRTVSLAVEFCGTDNAKKVREAMRVFGMPGYLYVFEDEIQRRIYCNQVSVAEPDCILKGRISSVVVQFVCDSPYFEDAEITTVPLYKRVKLLETPFELPCVFGDVVMGADIEVTGDVCVEPIITLYYPKSLNDVENIVIKNETVGAVVELDYKPAENDTVTIDIKNRRVFSSVNGNLVGYLSDETFLSDFVLEKGINTLKAHPGDVTSGFTAECSYCNLYGEAVIV